jgi:hypothetical protein
LILASALASAQQPSRLEKDQTPKRSAPRYTDEDLARYRERREGAELPEAERSPPADPENPGSRPGQGDTKPRREKPKPVRVVLEDRNHQLSPEDRQKAERIAERMVTLYGDPVGTEGPLVIPLRYFDSEEDYVEYATRISWVNPRWHGFYDTGRKEIVVGNRGAGFEILVHEVSHFIVGRVLPGAPRWFDEGLSEYFERASFRGDGTRWSAGASHQSGLADWSKAGQRPDLRELMGMNTWTWIDHDWEKGYIVRALAWSVVDLMMSSEGNKTLRDFIGAVRERSGRHSYEALERTYPGGARAFEGAWLERVNRQVGLAH